jgi:site-specific DNA recombinase
MKKRVIIYCRKSSEGEDRQVLSIQSQINELKEIAIKLNLEVIDTLTESKSAKAPGRPIFSKLIERVHNKEAEAILCWKLDRLARNAVDGGSIIWTVKTNGTEIITPSQVYSHESENTLLMYVEFGMAQKFIDDLGKNAKRGMKTKAEQGWYPAPAPIGYKNTPSQKKGFKIIKKDSKAYPLVRKAFEEVLKGRQAVDVWINANQDWKLSVPGNKPISRSAFYHMLNNPFYYGEYEWPKKSGNWYVGKHNPVITRQEFELVQKVLGKHGKPIAKKNKHNFDLTGIFQ